MKHSEWFESWFNSPYYCLLYQNRNEEEASVFLEKLLHFLHPPAASKMLDMPCGRGRHSIYLASKGYEVLGADLSTQNISIAKKFETDNLTFVVHDMRDIFYINYFDFAFNLFTSLGYFSTDRENADALRAFSNALKKGGKLVVDFLNTEKAIREMQPLVEKVVGDVTFRIQKKLVDKIIVKDIRVNDKGKEFHFEERVQAFTLSGFEKYFAVYNLKIVQLFGNYNLQPYQPNESERLIIIAEKIG